MESRALPGRQFRKRISEIIRALSERQARARIDNPGQEAICRFYSSLRILSATLGMFPVMIAR